MATSTVEDLGPCKKLLRIVVPAEEVQKRVDEQYEQIRENVAVAGFRKGRAPRQLLEKRFAEQVEEEVKDDLMAEAGKEALDENGLAMIGEPSYDNVEFAVDSEFKFEVTVEVKPEFELPEYKGLKVVRPKAEVSDEDVNRQLEALRRERAVFEEVNEGAYQPGDALTVDWHAECEGEQVASEDDVFFVPGGNSVGGLEIENIEEALAGVGVGGTCEAEAVFPEAYPVEAYRGKKGKAVLKVRRILRPELPELDDEFAKSLDFEGLDDLQAAVREELQRRAERHAQEELEREATKQLLDAVSIEVPEGVVKLQSRDILLRQQMRMRYNSVPEEEIQAQLNALQGMSEDVARREFQTFFLFEKIAEKEKIFVTEDEVVNRVQTLAAAYRMSVPKMLRYFEERGGIGPLRAQMRDEKVLETILSHAEIQDAP